MLDAGARILVELALPDSGLESQSSSFCRGCGGPCSEAGDLSDRAELRSFVGGLFGLIVWLSFVGVGHDAQNIFTIISSCCATASDSAVLHDSQQDVLSGGVGIGLRPA